MADSNLSERLARLEESLHAIARNPIATSLVPTQIISASQGPPGTIHAPNDESMRVWLLSGFIAELRLIPKMYLDPRYRLSRATQLGIPLLAILMIVSYLFFNYSLGFIPALPQVLERIVLILLAVLAYKVLSREAQRYRDVLDYLAKFG